MDRSSEKLLRLLDDAKEASVSLLGLLSLAWLLVSASAEDEVVLVLTLASDRGGLSDEEEEDAAALRVPVPVPEPNKAASKPGKLVMLELSVKGCAFAAVGTAVWLHRDVLPPADRRIRRWDRGDDLRLLLLAWIVALGDGPTDAIAGSA